MKRVCIILAKYYPQQPIASRSAAALLGKGYQVDVICSRRAGQKKQETIDGVNVYRLPVGHRRESMLRYFTEYTAFFTLAALKLSQLSIRKRYDVVQVCTMPDFLVFSTFFAKLLGTKVILYMFEYMPELFATTFNKDKNHPGVRLLRFLEKISTRYAQHVIVVCNNQGRRVQESNGLPAGKVTVVPNVPDETIFTPQPITVQKDPQHFRLITHGTLLKRQGVQTLIRAVPLLLDDIPELKVDILGDGDYRPELEKLAGDLGLQPYINFAGSVYPREVPAYIAQADVGVVAHLFDLMLPHKVFEYLAMSKPIVAADHSHLRDNFDGDTMLFYQPDNERDLAHRVLELYRSKEKRDSLSTHAQQVYQRYRWQVTKQEYLRVFEELLDRT
jgi:glycosyltransferase involved in cell wall biosynthesis